MTTYYIYPKFLAESLGGTIKAMLLTDAFAGFNAAHDFVDDIVANEVNATGYAQQAVPGSFTSDENGATFTPSGPVSFPAISATVQYVAFFLDAADNASKKVIGLVKFDSPILLTNKILRLTFPGALFEGLA